jgi:toxin-antitoxin system PIN domain toxin
VSIGLLDVNVLIALAWPSHVHHAQAHNWFDANASKGWATCPITQLGFVRISSNPKIIPEAVSPQQALQMLAQIVSHPQHVFWPADLPLGDERYVPGKQLIGHRQLTDAYLLGLAAKHKGCLVTLDESIVAMLSATDPKRGLVVLIG